ncbi:MAG TPA: hypothetical protein VK973_04670, partial [Arenicellales bacterium]|nr:hypothetical protein [Arenicellales bacterium]
MDSAPGQHWYHELRTTKTGLPWQRADEYAPDDPVFDHYWKQISNFVAAYGHIGDSNSWPPESLPYIHQRIMPIERVIYLTRDKDKQLHSIMNHS